LNRRDIKHRTAPIDEKFGIVICGETILNFATLTTIRFEAEEGTDRKRGKRENKEGGKQKDKSSNKYFFKNASA